MQFNLDFKTEEFLKIMLKNALNQKIRVFFAGGAIRDNLLGVPTKDFDIIVMGNAVEFCSRIPEIKVKSVHKDFYTVKVLYDNLIFDVASTRTEKYPYSGCLPVVDEIGVDLAKDVKRRDFTINSMYCELKLVDNSIEYSLIDLVCGVEDLKNKTLKVLHDKSYIDDPTRILRGLGFKYRFGFDFSNHDCDLINGYFKNINRENMSVSRVCEVFKKILSFDCADNIFREIVEKKYYKILFDNDLYVDFDLIKKIIFDLELTNGEKSDFLFKILENNFQKIINESSIVSLIKLFSRIDKPSLAYYLYKTQDINVYKYFKAKEIKLFLNGEDLIKLGYKKGPVFSEILDKLLDEKFKNPLKFPSINEEQAFVLENFPLD